MSLIHTPQLTPKPGPGQQGKAYFNSPLPGKDYGRTSAQPGCVTILLVEDNPGDVELVREALAENLVLSQIFVASDGEEAIRVIDSIDVNRFPCPDLIVLDVNLPKISGFRVLQRVRASAICGSRPVAIFTSSDAAQDRREAVRLGASRYIRKPADLKEFMGVGRELKEMLG